MLQEALRKLQAEAAAAPKDKFTQVIASFLMQHIQENPEDAERIVQEGKTIAGSLDEMKKEAKKQAVNNMGVLTNEEGFGIVLRYYGVQVDSPEPAPTEKPVFKASIDDLL